MLQRCLRWCHGKHPRISSKARLCVSHDTGWKPHLFSKLFRNADLSNSPKGPGAAQGSRGFRVSLSWLGSQACCWFGSVAARIQLPAYWQDNWGSSGSTRSRHFFTSRKYLRRRALESRRVLQCPVAPCSPGMPRDSKVFLCLVLVAGASLQRSQPHPPDSFRMASWLLGAGQATDASNRFGAKAQLPWTHRRFLTRHLEWQLLRSPGKRTHAMIGVFVPWGMPQ